MRNGTAILVAAVVLASAVLSGCQGTSSEPASLETQIEQATEGKLAVAGIALTDADLERIATSEDWKEVDLSAADLRGVTHEGIAHLTRLASLEALVLGNMPLSDVGLARLAELPELRRLNVVGTRVTDEGMAAVERFPKLVQLRMGAPAVSAKGLVQLKQRPLEWLILVEMQVNEAAAAELCQMKSLQSLYLVECDVSDAVRSQLEKSIPHVH